MGVRNTHSFGFPVRNWSDPVGLHKNFRYLEDYLKRLSVEGKHQAPTVIVAPSDYPNPEHANIVLTGTADEVKVNAAIADTDDAIGGWVHILPGTVVADAKITTIGSPGLLLTGSGWDTAISGNADTRDGVLELGANSTVQNLLINGESDFDYCVSSIGDNNRLLQVRLINSKVANLYVGTNSDYGVVENSEITSGDALGVHLDGSSSLWRFDDSSISLNTGTGIDADGNDHFFVNCLVLSNGGFGFDPEEEAVQATACYIDDNTSGNVNGVEGHFWHNVIGGVYAEGDHTAAVADHDLLINVSVDDHHNEAHSVASHDDTTATGTELETLTDGSNADALHDHAHDTITSGTIADHDTGATGTELDTLTDGSDADALHVHADADLDKDFFNGTFVEAFDATVSEAGGTVSLDLAKKGGGNLTCRFGDGLTAHTAGAIALDAGSDASPTKNYVYILESDPTTLVKDTSSWPATEHIKVAFLLVPSATFVAANGVYVNQNWNDGREGSDDQGHLSHIAEHIRAAGAVYFSGVDGNGTSGYLTIGAGNVELKSTAGVVYQLHKHTVPAFDTSGTDIVLVKNWNGTAYNDITDLYSIVADSGGNTITNNKWFNLVLWGVANKSGAYDPMLINLPSGFYNTQSAAEADTSGYDDFVIPRNFLNESSTGYLIARITVQMATGGGSWGYGSTVDLRGLRPVNATGGAAATQLEFPDNTFRIQDEGDLSKQIAFQASGISGTTTRTLTVQDADGTLEYTGHAPESHSGTGITGAELETLSDGSDADGLHTHGAIQTDEEVEDVVGGMLGGTETGIAVTYQDGTGDIDFVLDSEITDFFTATDMTGAEAETLSDGSDADSLHTHGVHTPDAHAASHAENASDEIVAENLGATSTDVSTNLKPDGTGGVEFVDSDHDDLANVGTDDHHTEAHAPESHTGTDITAAELETLSDTSDADALHTHSADGIDTSAVHVDTASEISGIANKATPAVGDFMILEDSAAANIKKHMTVANLEAVIRHDSIVAGTILSHDTDTTGAELT